MIAGVNAATGQAVEIHFNRLLERIDVAARPSNEVVYVSPGFIDLQVNGFGGVDYNSPDTSVEQIHQSLQSQFRTGVTRLFPTVITGPQEQMEACLRRLTEARDSLPFGHAIEGFHVEGPHISPEDGPRGAHPLASVRPPNLGEFDRLQAAAAGRVRVVTLSPEWPQAANFTRVLAEQGVTVSIGHTRATSRQIAECVAAGATMSTHLGNGAHPVLPKFPNYLWDQLAEPRLTASFIVDGIHLEDAFLRVGLRAKGIDRSVLVTDSVMSADCAPGLYLLGELDVELHQDGRVTLLGTNRLAGSSLTMNRGVSNLMSRGNLCLPDALRMATVNPARVAGVEGRRNGIAPGERADLIRFTVGAASNSLRILETYVSGRLAYQA